MLIRQPTSGPLLAACPPPPPPNPSALGKLTLTWHISSEPGTHALGRVVREAKLQTKLVERSSGKLGPIPFPHQEAVKEVIDSLEREGFFSKTCTLIPSGCDELSFFSLLSFYLEDGSRNQTSAPHLSTHTCTNYHCREYFLLCSQKPFFPLLSIRACFSFGKFTSTPNSAMWFGQEGSFPLL